VTSDKQEQRGPSSSYHLLLITYHQNQKRRPTLSVSQAACVGETF
jgi:hypothetical protein